MKRGLLGFATLCGFLLFASNVQATAKKQWTILIFLNADSNLSDAGYDDIHEMEKFGSNDDVNVVVQFDDRGANGTERIFIEKNETGVYPDGPLSYTSPVVVDMDEQDMGSTETLKDFLAWGMQNYPAEHYFVILWNHGSGWSKDSQMEINRSISYDDTSGTHIRTNELADAFDDLEAMTGERIDIIGFDACLMGMLEVADSLVGLADYMIGSQEVEPFDGYPYDDLLETFYSRILKSPEQLVSDVVETYGMSYSGGSQGTKAVTQTGVDLNALALVKRRLNRWIESLHASEVLTRDDLLKAASMTQKYYDQNYRDLGHYVDNILELVVDSEGEEAFRRVEGEALIGASIRLRKAIDQAVISNFNSAYYLNSTGLAVYLPYGYNGNSSWNSSYGKERKDAYHGLRFAIGTNWTNHLDLLFPMPEPEPEAEPTPEEVGALSLRLVD